MGPVRILIVDYCAVFRRFIMLFLEQQEGLLVVGSTGSGTQAEALARLHRPHAIVVDLGTPGLVGLETLACLRKALPDVSLVATTLLRDQSYRQVALRAGADAVVSKRDVTSDLLPLLRRLVQAQGAGGKGGVTPEPGAHDPEGGQRGGY